MTKRALRKDLWMEIRRNKGRFISIFMIVLLGVAFFSGLRSSESDMRLTADHFADQQHLMDLRIVSSLGLTEADREAVLALDGVAEAEGSPLKYVLTNHEETELVLEMTAVPESLNLLQVTEGRLPSTPEECLADNRLKHSGVSLGDVLEVSSGTEEAISESLGVTGFTVVGFGDSPMYLGIERGSATIGSGQVNGFIAVKPEVFLQDYYTQLFVRSEKAAEAIGFTPAYDEAVDLVRSAVEAIQEERCEARYEELRDAISEKEQEFESRRQEALEDLNQDAEAAGGALAWLGTFTQNTGELAAMRAALDAAWAELESMGTPEWMIYDRDSLPGYSDYGSNAERIGAIGKVFPTIFFLVAALVSLTALTRMVEEQRTQIGTYKALGYGKASVMGKYLTYALLATLGGGVAGVLIGEKLFPFVIILAYRIMYTPLHEVVIPYNLTYALLSVLLAAASTSISTFAACYRALSAMPAVMMRPAAPKAGKRVWLEHITILWKHLSFSQKATLRNLFRYKKRLVMTVFGIGCCCGLMVVGFGLKDSIMNIGSLQYDNIQLYDAMVSIREEEDEGQEGGGTASAALLQALDADERIDSHVKLMMKSMDASTGKAVRTAYVVVAQSGADLNHMVVFADRESRESFELEDGSVIISEQMAGALGVKEGDSFRLSSGEELAASPTVTHIAENYLMHYVYMTAATYEELFGVTPDYNMYWLKLTEEGRAQQEELGRGLIENETVLTVTYVSSTREMIENMLDSLYIIVIVLVISASLLAFVVIYNLNNINISERRRELATLKLLGFFNLEVAAYVYRENVYLTLLGAFLGLGIGRILHSFVIHTIEVNQVMFGREVSGTSFFWCVVLTIVFSAFVNFVMFFQLKKIDMIESLKSVE